MTGKVPNLPPNPPTQHIKGRLSVKYNQKFQRWVIRSWPKGNGGITPARAWAQKNFADGAQLIKLASADERDAADELAANTPFLQRDLLMRAAFGNLVEVTWADGSTSIGRRVANLNIQQLLDSISADDGAMLVRTDVGWLALLAGGDNQVLTMDPGSKLPQWADAQGGGGAGAEGQLSGPVATNFLSENHAAVGLSLHKNSGQTLTGIGLAMLTAVGATYEIRIAEFDEPTAKMTAASILLASFTGTAAANSNVYFRLAPSFTLDATKTYIIFVVRTDSTTTVNMQVAQFTSAVVAPGLWITNSAAAAGWTLSSIAPAVGVAWTGFTPAPAFTLSYTY